jgi:hypothetical protein
VVLALLRWRWSLSGREGLGPFLPLAELARRDSGIFEELKQETEANGGHRSDRTRSLFDRTRPVSVQRQRVFRFLIGRGGTSGHSRPNASGH